MGQATTGWHAKRLHMLDKQLERRGIRDRRVLSAMAEIPRELFVPESVRAQAYNDEPVNIGYGQTISQPYMVALMAQCLELTGSETVLEVGGGCGYHAAVLASLAAKVVSVEIVPELAEEGRRNLEAAGFGEKVVVVAGDGSEGYADLAPYDAISVAAAAPAVLDKILGQLTDPGRAVIPIGSMDEQELVLVRKSQGTTTSRVVTRCRFVPLRGGGGWRAG